MPHHCLSTYTWTVAENRRLSPSAPDPCPASHVPEVQLSHSRVQRLQKPGDAEAGVQLQSLLAGFPPIPNPAGATRCSADQANHGKQPCPALKKEVQRIIHNVVRSGC
eukprot:scaffold333138_cov33-Prasinocladus_malaysianus.AAC.2